MTEKALESLRGLLDRRTPSRAPQVTQYLDVSEPQICRSTSDDVPAHFKEKFAFANTTMSTCNKHSLPDSTSAWDTEIAFFVCWLLAASATHSNSNFRRMHMQEEQQRHRSLDLQRLGGVRQGSDSQPNTTHAPLELKANKNNASHAQVEGDRMRKVVPKSHPVFCFEGSQLGDCNYVALLSEAIHGYDMKTVRLDDLVIGDFDLFENKPTPDPIKVCEGGVSEDVLLRECTIRDEKTLRALVDQLQDSSSPIVQRLAALILLWCPGWWERVAQSVSEIHHKEDIHAESRTESHLSELLVGLKGKLQSLPAVDVEDFIFSVDGGAAKTLSSSFLRLHAFLVLLFQVLEEGNNHHSRLLQQQDALRTRVRLVNKQTCAPTKLSSRNVNSTDPHVQGTTNVGGKVSSSTACNGVCDHQKQSLSENDSWAAFDSNSSDTHASVGGELEAKIFTKQVLYPCKQRMRVSLLWCRALERKRTDLQRQLRAYQTYIDMTRTKVEALVRVFYDCNVLAIPPGFLVKLHLARAKSLVDAPT